VHRKLLDLRSDISERKVLWFAYIDFEVFPVISIAMWFVFDIASREFREFCNNVFLNLTLCCTLLHGYSLCLQEWSTQLFQDSLEVWMTVFLDQTGFCRCRFWWPLAFFFPSVYQGSSYVCKADWDRRSTTLKDDFRVDVRIGLFIYAVADGVAGKEWWGYGNAQICVWNCFDES